MKLCGKKALKGLRETSGFTGNEVALARMEYPLKRANGAGEDKEGSGMIWKR